MIKESVECSALVAEQKYELNSFLISPFYHEYLDSILIPKGLLESRIELVASQIVRHYQQREYVCFVVMKGSCMIADKLFEYIHQFYKSGSFQNQIIVDYIRIKSYLNQESTGKIQISHLDLSIAIGKEVLIIEDIVDTGNTLTEFLKEISKIQVKDVKIFSMLNKQARRNPLSNIQVDFLGFEIPDYFVVGYGLDYNEYFRDLPHVTILNQKGIQKFRDTQ